MPHSAQATNNTRGFPSGSGDHASARSIANVAVLILLLLSMNKLAAQSPPSEAPAAFHVLEATIDDVHAAIRSGRTTCRELVELYLKRIAAYDKSGPHLNAVQSINPNALQEADRLDAAFK